MTKPADVLSYRSLLSAPGLAQAFLGASLGRLSNGMVSLSMLFVGRQATGSFTAPGLAIGAYSIANLIAPLKARMLDRRGQPVALTVLGVPYSLALLAYTLVAVAGVAGPVPFVALGALAGLTAPPLGAAMRALWSALAETDDTRGRAYSLDVAVEETLLVSGPVLTGALTALAGPALALLVTALATLLGTVAMVTSGPARRLAAVPVEPGSVSRLGPLRRPGFTPLMIVILGLGLALGLTEVAVAAIADRAGARSAAGYVLAALSLGSAAGGLVWGRMRHRNTLSARLSVLLLAFGFGISAAALAPNLYVLAAVLAATGLALAPAIVTGYVLAEGLALRSQRTEATTWVNNAINIGTGLGSAAAGLLVERVRPFAGFLVAGLAVALGLALLLAGRRRLESSFREGTRN